MILIVCDQVDGAVDELSLQAVALGRSLGGPVDAVVFGGPADAATLGAHGVATVHVAEHEAFASFAPDAQAAAIAELAERIGATAVIGVGTERGNDVMARAATRLGEPMAANCTAVSAGSPLVLSRVRWGGSLIEEAELHSHRAMLTAAPHSVAAEETGGDAAAVSGFTPKLDPSDLVVRVSDHVAPPAGGVSLAEAKVVVTGGRGVGSAEGFAPVEELAALLGGAVGCSRAVTMAGWRSHNDQVGQTGTKISPEIYIPCGVSGATQHIAGCKGAKRILAINKDPEAPIMMVADWAVIGDLHEVLPAVSAEIRRQRG